MAGRTMRNAGVNPAELNRTCGVAWQDGNASAAVVGDQLEASARQRARQILTETLREEVVSYLQRGRYHRPEEKAALYGFHSGTSPPRLTLDCGTIDVPVPRVRGIPEGQDPYESRIRHKYRWSIAVIRGVPYRPYNAASSMTLLVSGVASSRPMGRYRCVARDWPRTRHARRSDTSSRSATRRSA